LTGPCASEYRFRTSRFSRREVDARHGRSAIVAALCVAAAAALSACSKSGTSERITLPPTPVLSIHSTWAVVKSPLLRVREEPSSQATVLSHVRMGAVVEVLTRGDKEETVENESAYWYRIDYQGLKGWVFGSYIELFDSRSKADRFSASLQ
jgi:uncharacterized protein YgiM (DUF1202 family)